MSDSVMGRIVGILDVNDTKFTAGIAKAKGQFSGLHSDIGGKSSAITGLIGGIGTAMLAVGAIKFLGDAVKVAVEDEVALTRLKTAVKATGASFSDYASGVEAAAVAGIKLGYTDDQTTEALSKLTTMTGSTSKALNDLGLSQNLARATGMDLASAASLVAKVEEGRIGIAARQLPFLKATMTQEEAMAALREHTAGQAASFADTAAGAQARWAASYEKLQESIGQRLLPTLTSLSEKLVALVGWYSSLDPATRDAATNTVLLAGAFGLLSSIAIQANAALVAVGVSAGLSGVFGSLAASVANAGVAMEFLAAGESVATVAGMGLASVSVIIVAMAAAFAAGYGGMTLLINAVPGARQKLEELGKSISDMPLDKLSDVDRWAYGIEKSAAPLSNVANLQTLYNKALQDGSWSAYDAAVATLKHDNALRAVSGSLNTAQSVTADGVVAEGGQPFQGQRLDRCGPVDVDVGVVVQRRRPHQGWCQ